MIEVNVKGSPSIEIGFERKVVDSYKAVDSELSTTSENPLMNKVVAVELKRQSDMIDTFIEDQGEQNEAFKDEVNEEISKKANQDGKYPQLTSGFASNLVGRGESTESEFSFRASGGKSIEDGAARISELRGNGVVWNQSLENGDFSKGKQYWGVMNNNSFVVEDGVATITLESVPTSDAYAYLVADSKTKCIVGHKYYVSAEGNIPRQTTLEISSSRLSLLTPNAVTPAINTWTRVAAIAEGIKDASATFAFYARQTVGGWEVGDQYKVRNYQFIDLTLMFGAGDEPTTLEEFYARKPIGVDEYAYNEGTLIPFNADAIKSVGFNAWDEEWELGTFDDSTHKWIADNIRIKTKKFIRILPNTKYHLTNPTGTASRYVFYDENQNYLSFVGANSNSDFTTPSGAHYMLFGFAAAYGSTYNNDVCIHLVHTGYRNGEYQPYEDFVRPIDPRIREAFPNGMKPWDKVYNKNGKGYIVKGSGSAQMRDLTGWGNNYIHEYGHTTFYCDAPQDVRAYVSSEVADMICSNAPIASWADLYAKRKQGVGLSYSTLRFYIEGIEELEDIKAYFQDATLWYELADEYKEVIEYDEPFNLDYEVWDFGTEEILSEQPSAPISADIIYQFNAVDTIRNNQLEIAQLKAMIATMQAQMASLTSNNIEE